MFDLTLFAITLPVLLGIAVLTWLGSLHKRDASIIDSIWPLFFLAALLTWWNLEPSNGPRAVIALILVGIWAVRLSGYLTWRNLGHPEDRRYQAIRARNQPNYEIKSLVLVFVLQSGLAWLIALPILPVLKSSATWTWLDSLGASVFVLGLIVEILADWQLARFKARLRQTDAVLNTGLWYYSRHPNYFGEAVVWWGFFLMAVGAGAPFWMLLSPALITFLLLKVSGVPLLEQDMAQRRPAYNDYVRNTSAFIPWPPRGD